MATRHLLDIDALERALEQRRWNLHLGRRIGEGDSATVYRASGTSPQSMCDEDFAVKVVYVTDENKVDVQREAALSLQLDHPNIVKTHAVLGDVEVEVFTYTVFIMELCQAALADVVANRHRRGLTPMPDHGARDVMGQLFDAVEYMHAQRVTHRHINPENILLAVDAERTVTIKIADFGLAQRSGTIAPYGVSCNIGGYAAPELLAPGSHPYDESVDSWPLGVILSTMLTGTEGPVTQDTFDRMSSDVQEFILATT